MRTILIFLTLCLSACDPIQINIPPLEIALPCALAPGDCAKTDEEFDIGGPNGLLVVGQSFDRTFTFTQFNGETCTDEPVTFVGFTMIAEVIDVAGVVLDTISVDPSVGDTTGSFDLHLDDSQVTTTLRDTAVKWKFRMIDGGPTNELLLYNNFKVT